MSKFRIEVGDSTIRRWVFGVLFAVFIASVWSWGRGALPYQTVIQLVLSVALAVYFFPQIVVRQPHQVLLVQEDGLVTFLQPSSDVPWRISEKSRFNGWWHWLIMTESVLNTEKRVMLFKDSVKEEDWRHLCRIVNLRNRERQ
ncbi:protein YgfX [Planctobacterium marinum]|uniref:Uncharacterized protein n=1 Tax=Planctobacterium marinum TaxID=1631968 RepID=A0AA48HPD8_9ALTE|nr:hypothetical protein MACH26_27430 [Planctobacterium marinum]